MRINRLDIKGFGKFNNFEVEFDRGFNVVFGENESGKSTIQAFIKAMFYSLRGGRSLKGEEYTPLNKYKPWVGMEYKGSLRYVLDDGQVFTVERDFQKGEAKIFDSLYKDITKTFDQSKNKGPLFAEKHIGLTENCFEKTLYIGQMATKIDNSDKKEILNNLANISETGSEDISFINASGAIKEALKMHVGTDKTSIRPLDTINSKLVQLKDKRQTLLKVKESMFALEEEVTDLNKKKSWFEELKTVIKFAKDIVNIREEIEVNNKRKKDIADIICEISELSKECDNLKKSIKEYENTKELLGRFSDFELDEADDFYIKYAKYENLIDKNKRLRTKIEKIRRNTDEIGNIMEELKEFEYYRDINLGDSALSSEIASERVNLAEIQNKIGKVNLKNRTIVTAMATVGLSLFALLFYGILSKNYYYLFGNAVLLLVFIVTAICKSKNGRFLELLKDEESEAEKKLQLLLEKMEKQKSIQDELFKRFEVSSVEELLKKKVLYESKAYELNSQIKRMAELEEIFEKNCTLIDEISKFIKEKLLKAQIIESIEVEIIKGHVEAFRSIVNKCREAAANLNIAEDKLKGHNKQIENLYLRACSLCGQRVDNIGALTDILNDMEKKIEKLYEELDIYAYKIKTIYADREFEGITYDKLMEILMDFRIEDAKKNMEKFTQRIYDGLNVILLTLKEKELALSAINDNNNELEKVEEEIRELTLRKEKLEELGFSLKTALEVLEEANTEIKRDFAPAVNSKAAKLIGLITDNRYKELKVDEDLVLRTTEPYLKNIVTVSALSGGTVEQMYLTLRIALVQTIEKKSEKLPLLLDEVLSQYDESRALNTINMLKEVSKERQVIFFTCKMREVEMAKSVCNSDINIIKL